MNPWLRLSQRGLVLPFWETEVIGSAVYVEEMECSDNGEDAWSEM